MADKQKNKEQLDINAKITELKKAVERAEGRGQFETSYHVALARLLNPPKADKEVNPGATIREKEPNKEK